MLFVISKVISCGLIGLVYRAVPISLGRRIKVLRPRTKMKIENEVGKMAAASCVSIGVWARSQGEAWATWHIIITNLN